MVLFFSIEVVSWRIYLFIVHFYCRAVFHSVGPLKMCVLQLPKFSGLPCWLKNSGNWSSYNFKWLRLRNTAGFISHYNFTTSACNHILWNDQNSFQKFPKPIREMCSFVNISDYMRFVPATLLFNKSLRKWHPGKNVRMLSLVSFDSYNKLISGFSHRDVSVHVWTYVMCACLV